MKIVLMAIASLIVTSNAFAWGSKAEPQASQKVICVTVDTNFGEKTAYALGKVISQEISGKVKSISNLTAIPATVLPAYSYSGGSTGPQTINSAQICAVVTF